MFRYDLLVIEEQPIGRRRIRDGSERHHHGRVARLRSDRRAGRAAEEERVEVVLFHRRVDSLPADQKAVFEMHHYLGLPQAEVARLLNLHPRKVSYLWIEATEQLTDGMAGALFTE